jgi:uncharacterized protein (TIGR00369 family)
MEMIGGDVEVWEEGRVVMSLRLADKHMNPNGVLHGGVLTSLLDEATGAAIVTIRGLEVMAEAPHATVEMSVVFVSGARPGDEIIVEARVLRVGRAIAFAEGEVRCRGTDDLIAKGQFTYAILQKRGG